SPPRASLLISRRISHTASSRKVLASRRTFMPTAPISFSATYAYLPPPTGGYSLGDFRQRQLLRCRLFRLYLRWILHGLELRLRIPPIERPEGVNLRPVVDTGQHLSLEGARRPHAPFTIIAGTLSRNEPGVE